MKLPIRAPSPDRPPREMAAEWLHREEEGPLSTEERERLNAWLGADPSHREAYEEVAYVYGLSDEHAAAASIMSLRQAALAADTRRRPPAWGIATAAGLAVAVALGWAGLSSISNAPTASPSAITRVAEMLGARTDPASAVYRTRVGERLTFNLPDGSVTTLNTNSILKVAYGDGERGVRLLQGQALFEVAKNKRVPFRVYAGDRQITAVGTVFDVRLDGGKVKVALVEGAVRVAARPAGASGAPAQQVELAAGEVLEAEKAAPMVVVAADVKRAVTWKSGLVEFAGEPLAEAVDEINRYTDHPIQIADPSIAGLRVSGVFRTGEPKLFARMVSEVVPVAVEHRPDGVTILKERAG